MRTTCTLLALLLSTSVIAADVETGYFEKSFNVIPPYARGDVIALRTFSEEARAEVQANPDFQNFTVDPREEKWQVYVPEGCTGETRCGLLVWIHAEDAPRMPGDWRSVLDEENVIFVAAMRSGNEHDAFQRRLPMALMGLGGIAAKYPIDSSRVYAGGFSGGSKTAQILAFGFPDVFHGVILNAGFLDPESGLIAMPPAPLDEKVKTLPLAFIVGRKDEAAWPDYVKTRNTLEAAGFTQLLDLTDPRLAHRPMNASSLRKAIEYFDEQ